MLAKRPPFLWSRTRPWAGVYGDVSRSCRGLQGRCARRLRDRSEQCTERSCRVAPIDPLAGIPLEFRHDASAPRLSHCRSYHAGQRIARRGNVGCACRGRRHRALDGLRRLWSAPTSRAPSTRHSPAAPTTWRQRPNTSCSTTAAKKRRASSSFEDLAKFFALRPNPDKQFIDMPGIAHTSTRSKNFQLVYHLLDAYFGQPGAGAHGLSEAAQRIGPRLRASALRSFTCGRAFHGM